MGVVGTGTEVGGENVGHGLLGRVEKLGGGFRVRGDLGGESMNVKSKKKRGLRGGGRVRPRKSLFIEWSKFTGNTLAR